MDANHTQYPIDQSVLGAVEPYPDQTDGYPHGDSGQVIDGSESGGTPELLIEQHG